MRHTQNPIIKYYRLNIPCHQKLKFHTAMIKAMTFNVSTALFRIQIFCNVTFSSVGHSFHDIRKACNAFTFRAERKTEDPVPWGSNVWVHCVQRTRPLHTFLVLTSETTHFNVFPPPQNALWAERLMCLPRNKKCTHTNVRGRQVESRKQMVCLFSCILCGEISTYQKKLKYEYSVQM